MLYKDLGLISSVLDERRLPSLRGRLAIAHCRYSTTGSTIWENAQPTFRLGPRRALAIGHNGNLVNTRELLERLRGGRARLPASTDTELLTALLADEPAADTVDALVRVLPTRPRRVHPGRPRREAGHRRPRSARVPAARPRPPARARTTRTAAPGLWRRRRGTADGWCLIVRDGRPRHRRRRVRPRRRAGRDRRPRGGQGAALGPVRPGDPGPVRVRAHLLRPAGFVHGGPQPVRGPPADGHGARPRAPGRRPISSCRCRTPARRPRPATPRRPGSRTARASSATATPAGRSSSRPRRCASGA